MFYISLSVPFSFTYISGRQHVLRVNESSKQSHQLYCSTQLWVRVTNHLLDHYIYQQNILFKQNKKTKRGFGQKVSVKSKEKFSKASHTTEHLNQPINFCSPETTVLEGNAQLLRCPFALSNLKKHHVKHPNRITDIILLAYIISLLRFLHDKLSDHGGAEFHQV